MHFCSATVRLMGDLRNTVARTPFNPISLPEVEVLRFLHGDDSVIDVKPFASVEQTAKAEKERLQRVYGTDVLEEVFPGRNPQMELEATGARLAEAPVGWKNPLAADDPYEMKPPAPAPAAAAEKPVRAFK
jgi:hypothetical protein